MRLIYSYISLILLALCLSACSVDGDEEIVSDSDLRSPGPDNSEALFDPERLLQVDIAMDPDDFIELREDGRTFGTVYSGCASEFEYEHFRATVTIDGERVEDIDIRKKGFLGSISYARPSFKLNFDEFSPGRRFNSLERMTLNNNNQDPSSIRTCMTYQLFREAGLPAPRCNFARVTVNGEDLGIYSHVESIRGLFLRRNFGSDKGNLYEAQGADFGENLKENFQLKNNTQSNDRSDLDAVVSALRTDDENLPGLLGQVLDIDEFITYWAMESITGHWDSATGNANNHFLYNNPGDGRFHYIPWGPDAAFLEDSQLAPGTGPLYRFINIPSRLYQIPEYREKYHDRILELLDLLWDEQALNAEVDRMRDLLGESEADLASVREFIDNFETTLRAAVNGDITQIERTITDAATVCDPSRIKSIKGSLVDGIGTVEIVNQKDETAIINVTSIPISDSPSTAPGNSISIIMFGNLDGESVIFPVLIERALFGQTEVKLHGVTTAIMMGSFDAMTGFSLIAASGAGSITFNAPPVIGESVSMSFDAEWVYNNGSALVQGL